VDDADRDTREPGALALPLDEGAETPNGGDDVRVARDADGSDRR